MRKILRKFLKWVSFLVLFIAATTAGSMSYFHFASPRKTCISCHEMQASFDQWSTSAHAGVHCRNCHGGSLTTDIHALQAHASRVIGHFSKATHDDMRLSEQQVIATSEACRACHEHEFADWKAGGHSVTYADIFLNEEHNSTEQLNGDCLRCHGMFFQGPITDLVAPISTKGPWKLLQPQAAAQPAIPCLACHQVHAPGHPADRVKGKLIAATLKPHPARVALYSRHEKTHFAADRLPMPAISKNDKLIRTSADPRQRLCVQCHAPNAQHQAGASDDRTPTGVHEGLSCMACHRPHTNDARGSCGECHPALSHCGLDVEKMDTTYLSIDSKHNIHTVACGDCHSGKRPEKSRP